MSATAGEQSLWMLDANIISDLMRNPNGRVATQLAALLLKRPKPKIVTSVVVFGEIRYGLERLPSGTKRSDLETRAANILSALRMEPIVERIAEAYGRFKAWAEKAGLTFDDNDLWIAATAIEHSSMLVTRDQMLFRLPGLRVEDWTV